jgi:hypothetical protein
MATVFLVPVAYNTALPQKPFGHGFDGSASGGGAGTINHCSTLVCSVRGGVGHANPLSALDRTMSVLIYPEFDRKFDSTFKTTGEFLGSAMEQLEGVAESMGLVPLGAFGDNRLVPDDFDGPPWEVDEVLGPWNEWFDCSAGVSAVEALSAALESESALRARFEMADAVVAELDDLAQQLRAGETQRARFRLQLSY